MAGHIRKRRLSDGSIRYQARLPNPARPRKPIVKTFPRRREAERWLTTQASAIQDGSFIDPRHTAQPFGNLVTTWERTHLPKLAPKTRERYESVTRTYLIPMYGSTPLGRLTRADFKEWFARLAAECKPNGKPRYAPGTLRKVQVVLSSILNEGVELGLLRDNPAARMRLPSSQRTDMTILTAGEIKALADAIPRASDQLAIYVAAYCGLRAGELWALQRRDIDLLHNRLHVRRALKDIRGHLEFGDTKTSGSRRTVSLPIFLQAMLTEHIESIPTSPDALLFLFPAAAGLAKRATADPSVTASSSAASSSPQLLVTRTTRMRGSGASLRYPPRSTTSASTIYDIHARHCSSPPGRIRSSYRPGLATPRSPPLSTATATCFQASRKPWQTPSM